MFDNFAKVKYVDFNKGQEEGYIRFGEENQAKEVLEKVLAENNGELLLKGAKVEGRVLEGEEEEEYWKGIIRRLSESRGRNKNSKNNSRRSKYQKGGKKGGKYNKNKRSLEDGDAEGGDDNENGHDGHEAENNGNANENSPKKLKTEDN